MKLYTKTGDKGLTNLYDMRRVQKTSKIFDVLGDLDELSVEIGGLASEFTECAKEEAMFLRKLQSKLLDLGSDLATFEKRNGIREITAEDIKEIEGLIDHYQSVTTPLKEFILPCSNRCEYLAQKARVIARRAERNMWKAKEDVNVSIKTGDNAFIYMNRMSDFFFAYSRYLATYEIKRSEVKV